MEKDTTIINNNHNGNRQKVGKRIAELRQQKGLSVRQLSVLCNMSASHLSKIENGKHSVGLDVLERICIVLEAEIMIIEKRP